MRAGIAKGRASRWQEFIAHNKFLLRNLSHDNILPGIEPREASCSTATTSSLILRARSRAEFAKANQLKVLHFTSTEGNGDEGLCGVDDLFVSRTAHEFYEAMRNGAAPQTSQPSQHEFESAFREAIESGIPAVYLAFDSGISGCYEGACMALDRLKDEYGAENVAVHIVDTKLPATPLNMLVWEAVRQREKGMPLEQMISVGNRSS